MSSACFTLSTYALVVASVLAVGVPTLVTLFDPISIVCEPATVKPPSKSAEGVKVAVPVTVTVSEPALPKVTFPFRVVLPSTLRVESKSAAP